MTPSVVTGEQGLNGQRCAALLVNGAIEKTTHTTFSAGEAEQVIDDLRTYASQLDASPLTTARLLDAQAKPTDGGSLVWHRQEYIDGPALDNLPLPERVAATRQVLGEIATMPTLGQGRRLVTPLDAKSDNFRVNGEGVAHFVDFMPPMVRDSSGAFATPGIPLFEQHAVSHRTLAMARLLQTVAPGDAAYDMLPDSVRGRERDMLRLAVARNYFAYRLMRKAVRIVS